MHNVCPSATSGITPTYLDVCNYFEANGFEKKVAQNFWEYNHTRGYAFSSKSNKPWQDFAELFMQRSKMNKQPKIIENNLTFSLEDQIPEEVIRLAIEKRVLQLMGSNERRDGLLIEAYKSGNKKDPLIINDMNKLSYVIKKILLAEHTLKP